MRGVTLHGAHQIGDQIVPLAQLRIDIGPALPHVLAQADEAIVNDNGDQTDDDDGDQYPQTHLLYSPSNGR